MAYTQKYAPEMFRILTQYDTEAVLELPMQLVELTGIGIPAMDTVVSRGPTQNGDTLLAQYAQPRSFVVGLALKNLWGPIDDRTKWGARQKLLAVANPALGVLTFEMVMTNGDVYQLRNVTVDAGFELGIDTTQNPRWQRVVIRFVAHTPIWFGKEYETTYNPTVDNVSAIPAWLYDDPVETLGSWFSSPEIDITGPVNNTILYIKKRNLDTLALDTVSYIWLNQSIAAGEHVYITTAYGERQVVDDNGDNVTLSNDTFLSTFELSPSPIRLLHDEQDVASWYQNYFSITVGSSVTADARITFRYSDRFLAI